MIDRVITIFGGGGFLGRYVAQELLHAGARLRIAERNPADAWFLKPLGGLGQTQFVAADITRPESLARAVEGADTVINLVGILKGDFDKVHAEGAGHVAAAAAAAGAGGFVQVSAVGADVNAPSHYLRSKARGEEAVRAAMPGAVVVRPSVIFGPEDGFLNRFAALARLPGPLPVMKPRTRFQPAYVADVAEAAARAAIEPARHAGATYELGGPQVMTMMEINRFVLDMIGKADKQAVAVPDAVGSAMARFGFMPGAPITWDQWLSLQVDNVVAEGAKGFEAFGIAPRPMATVAGKWMVQYRTHGRFAGKASGAA